MGVMAWLQNGTRQLWSQILEGPEAVDERNRVSISLTSEDGFFPPTGRDISCVDVHRIDGTGTEITSREIVDKSAADVDL